MFWCGVLGGGPLNNFYFHLLLPENKKIGLLSLSYYFDLGSIFNTLPTFNIDDPTTARRTYKNIHSLTY